MRKLLLGALLLLSTLSFSQVKTDTIPLTNKTIKWFKDVYVKENFKDPYSYQMMSHSTSFITMKEWIQNDLDYINKFIETYNKTKRHSDFDEKTYDRLSKNKIKYEEDLKNINTDYIKCYVITIEARGTNSYGGVVLSKYIIKLFVDDNFEKPKVQRI